jgi:transposase-like protein
LGKAVLTATPAAGLAVSSAQLVLQRAVEEGVTAFLARARYERTDEARGWRNGSRPKRLQTAEGEIVIQMPQLRGTVETFVSQTIPHAYDLGSPS